MCSEEFVARADILLEMATEIPLGAVNQTTLLQQAETTKDQVTQLEDTLKDKYGPHL